MKRLKRFVINALILGGTTIFMRSISVIFSAYVSNKIGAEGMGLFSLISSVYMFAVTLATSGISLAVTRLVSEELGHDNGAGAVQAVKSCVGYALVFGCSAAVLNGYLLRGMREGKWNRIIFAPTGALLSPTTTFQGESIPGICHAVVFSNHKEG